MKIRTRHRLTAACVAAAAALTLTALWLDAARARTAAPATLNLRDFGAVGDGTTDDGPALQSALDALAAAGGGTLDVPAGRYVIASPVRKDYAGLADSITIQGVASDAVVDTTGPGSQLTRGMQLVSEFYPRTHEQHVALSLQGLQSLLVRELAFVGTANVKTDALATIAVERVESATIRHCEFYALSTLPAGGAVVRARRSGLRLEQVKFLGSIGNSGVYVPVVENLEWKHVELTDVIFADYGQRALYGKTGISAPYSWVNVGNAAPVTADSPRREVVMRRVFLDEGGYVGLSSLPYRYQPASAPIDLYYITELIMNVSNLGTTGHYLHGPRAVLVEKSRYGWSHNTGSAIHVLHTPNTILDRIHTEADATHLKAGVGTGRFTVINSVYEALDSQAQTTRVINTAADSDDPVWYVRQQFNSVAGRDPDAAAHYYWSEQLLQCAEADAACVADRRDALNAYLASAPAPNFDLSGRVTDETGAGVAGASVALTGSQTVTTLTDAASLYRFRQLPTSGVYTVTVSKRFHTFAAPAQTFSRPNGDRTADFAGVLSRHAVGGRLVDHHGAALAHTGVVLSGSQGGTATTDAGGNYSFTNLPAGGNYTVAALKAGFVVAPAERSFNNLGANRAADFSAGAIVNHALAANGATAAASSTIAPGRSAPAAINGDRRGLHWGTDASTGSGWHDSTSDAYPDWLEVAFAGPRTLHEVSVFSVQDNFNAPGVPTVQTAFTRYGVVDFQVEYWTGAAWQLVPGGLVISNDKVWRRLTFEPLTTTKIRVVVNSALAGNSRLAEVEAWGPPGPPRVNHALAASGATAAASSTLDAGRGPSSVINGDRRGLHWGSDPSTGSGWHDSTVGASPDWVEVAFDGAKTINEVAVFSVQNNFNAPAEPTEQLTFTKFGVADFEAQYWTGSAWATLPGGNVTGNNRVWRRVGFPAVTTSKVRVLVSQAPGGHSRVVEVEAWGEVPVPPVNVAAAASGATATASSTLDEGRGPDGAINGDRKGSNWGAGGGWHDATNNAYPDWLQVNFAGPKTIGEVNVFTLQDNFNAPAEPTEQLTFTQYGALNVHVEYWTGSAWAAVPGGTASGSKVWKKITFAPLTTERIRVVVNSALSGHSRITEVEAY